MSATAFTTLAARARELADKTGSSFVAESDDSIYAFCNDAARRLHQLIVPAFGDYFERSVVIAPAAKLTGTVNDYALPADFYKLLGVDMGSGTSTKTLEAYTRAERNSFKRQSTSSYPRYKLTSRAYAASVVGPPIVAAVPASSPAIRFLPDITESVTVWYVGSWTTIWSSDAALAIVMFPNDWQDSYIPLFAAIRILQKGEEDSSEYRRELEKLEGEIKDACMNRDDGAPPQAVDYDAIDNGWPYENS